VEPPALWPPLRTHTRAPARPVYLCSRAVLFVWRHDLIAGIVKSGVLPASGSLPSTAPPRATCHAVRIASGFCWTTGSARYWRFVGAPAALLRCCTPNTCRSCGTYTTGTFRLLRDRCANAGMGSYHTGAPRAPPHTTLHTTPPTFCPPAPTRPHIHALPHAPHWAVRHATRIPPAFPLQHTTAHGTHATRLCALPRTTTARTRFHYHLALHHTTHTPLGLSIFWAEPLLPHLSLFEPCCDRCLLDAGGRGWVLPLAADAVWQARQAATFRTG